MLAAAAGVFIVSDLAQCDEITLVYTDPPVLQVSITYCVMNTLNASAPFIVIWYDVTALASSARLCLSEDNEPIDGKKQQLLAFTFDVSPYHAMACKYSTFTCIH